MIIFPVEKKINNDAKYKQKIATINVIVIIIGMVSVRWHLLRMLYKLYINLSILFFLSNIFYKPFILLIIYLQVIKRKF